MAHKPTIKMITTPHIEVQEHCINCPHMLKALAQDKVDWGTIRNACRCCKTGSSGIYKADAIYDFLKLYHKVNKNLTPGRKATRHKTHGQTVINLRSMGYSLQAISKTTGLAINTIRNIIREYNNDKVVRTLRSMGYSLQDISQTTGLPINIIRNVLKEGELHD